MVRAEVWLADRAAGTGLAGDSVRGPYADRGAYGIGQNARRVFCRTWIALFREGLEGKLPG